MKVLIVLAAAICAVSAKLQCSADKPSVPTEWLDMGANCTKAMRDQVQAELSASITYLSMGAYFSRDTVNRPGFAKFFFNAASEEREHAQSLISYLLMRGQLTSQVSSLIRMPAVEKSEWTTGVDALKAALRLEASVTKKIRGVIIACEDDSKFNDYHLVDYLTGDFLEEQYRGQRDIAGKVSQLDKMMSSKGSKLAEFLFDKKLNE